MSCGHSQCPLCQNRKRELWQQRISEKMLAVPYVHTVFTTPHKLNKLALLNEKVIYNITMRAAWQTIKELCAKPENVGGTPGMIAVLHTFGSDMKHHVHACPERSRTGACIDNIWRHRRTRKLAVA